MQKICFISYKYTIIALIKLEVTMEKIKTEEDLQLFIDYVVNNYSAYNYSNVIVAEDSEYAELSVCLTELGYNISVFNPNLKSKEDITNYWNSTSIKNIKFYNFNLTPEARILKEKSNFVISYKIKEGNEGILDFVKKHKSRFLFSLHTGLEYKNPKGLFGKKDDSELKNSNLNDYVHEIFKIKKTAMSRIDNKDGQVKHLILFNERGI